MESKQQPRSKWNTKRTKNEIQGKPLTPKAGEEVPTISRENFLEVLRKVSRRVQNQRERENERTLA